MINKEEFKAIMASCIVPGILKEYIEISNQDYLQAIHDLYNSEMFSLLSKKETKLWHLSPLQLAGILSDEINNGNLEIPEGAALWV